MHHLSNLPPGCTDRAIEAQTDDGGLDERACEWVCEHYPDANEEEWAAHYYTALADLRRIDAAADAVDR